MSKYIKWKLFCDLVLCQVSRDKEDEEGEEGQRGRENRRQGISAERGCVRVKTQEKNAKQEEESKGSREKGTEESGEGVEG